MAEEAFELTCVECGMPVRVSRVTDSSAGPLQYFIDEDGLEQRDFHFHQAVVSRGG